jgi:hypothetical protein
MLIDKLEKWFESILFLLFFSLFIIQGIVSAQNFSLEKSVVDHGGGASKSTNYQVVNAVGQPSPVSVIQSANYTVSAGFLADEKLTTSIDESNTAPKLLPTHFRLFQNYPNPFNPETTIQFCVKEPRLVELTVFDLLGRKVAELVNNHYKPGQYQIMFDASKLPTGIYFYQIRMGDFKARRKMVLLE